MIKKLLGIAPKLEEDGSYSPSKLALKLATSQKTDFENISYKKYQGKRSKILVIFSEHKNMTMKNGKIFSTGNHPVEALVPMMHLENAGFEFDITTASGKAVIFEMWAFPKQDQLVKTFYKKYQSQFQKPQKLSDFIDKSFSQTESYAAVFVPGGHGAMIDLPKNSDVGKTLKWAHINGLYTISLCHGPGSFLSTMLNGDKFIYEDYKMCVFPDSVDKQTPLIGYLPGRMPWGLSEKLQSLGVELMNTKADKSVCLDRKLITGASPLASNDLGKLAANTLLKALK